jgi:hypothetical protein
MAGIARRSCFIFLLALCSRASVGSVGKIGVEAADGSLATSPGEWSWSGSGGEGNRSLGSSLPQGIVDER